MKLVDVMGLEYSRSKNWLNRTLALSFGIQAMALLSLWLTSGRTPRVLALLAAVSQIGLFLARRQGRYHFGLAEQIRRLSMLHDGLGIAPPEDQLASIRERVGNPQDATPSYLDPYYESRAPKGYKRLVEITRESAFFTASLARTSAIAFGIMAGAGLVFAILTFVVVVQAGTFQPHLEIAAKAVLASMTFWVTGDLASMALQFHALSQNADRVRSQCANLIKLDDIGDAAHAVVGEYNCAVVQAPPIPDWIYRCRQHVLNDAWKKRQELAGSSDVA